VFIIALQHKLSDAIRMHNATSEKTNQPMIEIEFKFVRYQLIVDDVEVGKKLLELLKTAVEIPQDQQVKGPKMPVFYKNK